MALKHAILVALREGEATGYELSKRFDASVANFWPASAQQIYRELDRLESDGALTARVVKQSARPNKRLFTVTGDGEALLEEFIRSETRPTAIRDDLLVKVAALDDGNAEAVAAAVNQRLEASEVRVALYRQLQSGLLGDRTESEFFAAGDQVGIYLALLRGIAFEKGNRDWSKETLTAIASRRSGIPG